MSNARSIGLSPAASRLYDIASRERRQGVTGEFFAAPVERLMRELDCDRLELNAAVLLLQIHGCVAFELEAQGCIVFKVLVPVRIARSELSFVPIGEDVFAGLVEEIAS